MFSLLERLFIKNRDNTSDPGVRGAYGRLCGIMGIILNIMLFGIKYAAGRISGSIAVTADAFNNLSDAGSALITLAGFSLAARRPDAGHPFGHGRFEYLTGLGVSIAIILMGIELGKTSVEKIISPQPVTPGLLPALILALSILVKLYMFMYNRRVGKKLDSEAMLATASDSLSDSAATAVVLLSMGVQRLTGLEVDSWAGTAVALFIIWSGISAARDTLRPLLGQAPSPELVEKIRDIVMSNTEICGMHDLIVHDYGPGRLIISLHAEVDGSGDIFELHDAIDNVERELKKQLNCLATVHMDPIHTDNEELTRMRSQVTEKLRSLDGRISIHDFRMVPGPSHTNLIFDAVVPYGNGLTDSQAKEKISRLIEDSFPGCYAVVEIDRDYAEGNA